MSILEKWKLGLITREGLVLPIPIFWEKKKIFSWVKRELRRNVQIVLKYFQASWIYLSNKWIEG